VIDFRRSLAGLAASLVIVAVAAGCGGNGETGEPVATTDVTMVKSYRFDPKTIEVDDNFTHTVQVDGQEDHEVRQGESVSISFDTPGTYHYVCTLHRQDMDGEVIVT
jgi:plastocyanin